MSDGDDDFESEIDEILSEDDGDGETCDQEQLLADVEEFRTDLKREIASKNINKFADDEFRKTGRTDPFRIA